MSILYFVSEHLFYPQESAFLPDGLGGFLEILRKPDAWKGKGIPSETRRWKEGRKKKGKGITFPWGGCGFPAEPYAGVFLYTE